MLALAGIDMRPVEIDRRLPILARPTTGYLEEFSAPQLNTRLIVGNAHTPDTEAHRVLSEHGVPVLPASDVHVDGLYLWQVPLGTYPFRSVLHLVAQNVGRYGAFLTQARDISYAVAGTGMGALLAEDDRRILDHFAVVQTDEHSGGASIVLAPPYVIREGDAADSIAALRDELTDLGLFSPEYLSEIFANE